MKIGVNIKIDVTKIDKALLFQGQKGKYLDAVVFIDIDNQSQYGDNGIINQALGKDSTSKDKNGNLLGNVKVFWNDSRPQQSQQSQQQSNQAPQQYQQQAPPPAQGQGGQSLNESDMPW